MARASTMDLITVSNYRCFREKQTARLAPLTLLVGENSTGKTSFLALIRALWDVAFGEIVPDFREEPYDLGTFVDIAHHRGARGSSASSFESDFEWKSASVPSDAITFSVKFEDRQGVVFPVMRLLSREGVHMQMEVDNDGHYSVRFGMSKYEWTHHQVFRTEQPNYDSLLPIGPMLSYVARRTKETDEDDDPGNWQQVAKLLSRVTSFSPRSRHGQQRPFASAPVRSRPRRTYDPTKPSQDAEGEYIPIFLDNISRRDGRRWLRLKAALESFGKKSQLFDEISTKSLGKTDGSPFQVQIRKAQKPGQRLKGPHRNLIDVGYGVSQTLPVLTELLRSDSPEMFLLQQPEVHLHPRAQAALGTLFCSLASSRRQLIVETHSDYLIDRIRMDVRDKETKLSAEDVSILFFEAHELDVTINSLRLDQDGNIVDAPPSYRDFFMSETQRSLGF